MPFAICNCNERTIAVASEISTNNNVRATMTSAAPLCAACKTALEGECPAVNGKEYHARCFNCTKCATSLLSQPVRLLHDAIVCVACKKVQTIIHFLLHSFFKKNSFLLEKNAKTPSTSLSSTAPQPPALPPISLPPKVTTTTTNSTQTKRTNNEFLLHSNAKRNVHAWPPTHAGAP